MKEVKNWGLRVFGVLFLASPGICFLVAAVLQFIAGRSISAVISLGIGLTWIVLLVCYLVAFGR